MPTDAVAVLHRARTYIRGGWAQGINGRNWRGRIAPNTGAGEWDLVTALFAAAEDLDALGSKGGFTLALAAVTQACGENPQDWNDEKGRTEEQVLALVDETLEALTC